MDDKRPDAPSGAVSTHARNLASQVRTDDTVLRKAKVSPADADQLEVLASGLDDAQERWATALDQTGTKAVAKVRGPLREGRDHIFHALRTFADENATTQEALDDIADVQSDDDLVDDTVRLLALAKKHATDLEGTDLTPARVDEVRASLAAFRAVRGGEREADGARTSKQQESEGQRTARRARNRAFWALAALVRQVCKRGQYAFRDDLEKRAKYTLYTQRAKPTAPEGGTGGATG